MSIHYHTLTRRQFCDLTLLLNGGFKPLTSFVNQLEYNSIINHYRLPSGSVWPMPIVLDISEDSISDITLHDTLYLRNPDGCLLASMEITDIWKPHKPTEADSIYGCTDVSHPGVNYLFYQTQAYYVSGPITALTPLLHLDFPELYHEPDSLKQWFQTHEWNTVIGFQTRNPIHRAHYELTLRAAKHINANLLIHPVVGETKPGDIDAFTRVKCYQLALKHYPEHTAFLSLLPLAMRMAGPREALWHALIRKNYGCTHFIIGRDHAGPGKNATGNDFYTPTAAQQWVSQYQDEINIHIIPMDELHYVKNKRVFVTQTEIQSDSSISKQDIMSISGSELRHQLRTNQSIPSWFSFPEVLNQLQQAFLPTNPTGLTLFFTGLPGAGKSTLATALYYHLKRVTNRSVSLLDGDILRQQNTKALGFSKTDRDEHIKRTGCLAGEITKHHGIAICACIAPYEETRQWVRSHIEQYRVFFEIYVSTPLAICEQRDPKGLYKKARLNMIQHFTGIDDPYIPPTAPDLTINTNNQSITHCIDTILEAITIAHPIMLTKQSVTC